MKNKVGSAAATTDGAPRPADFRFVTKGEIIPMRCADKHGVKRKPAPDYGIFFEESLLFLPCDELAAEVQRCLDARAAGFRQNDDLRAGRRVWRKLRGIR